MAPLRYQLPDATPPPELPPPPENAPPELLLPPLVITIPSNDALPGSPPASQRAFSGAGQCGSGECCRRRRQAGGALARKGLYVVLGAHFAKAPGTRSTPRLAAPIRPTRIGPPPTGPTS